jgi:rifampicin phosphotransferase
MLLVTKKSTSFFARHEAGGKGFNLYLMSRMGLQVPDWVVLGRSYFKEFIKAPGFEAQLKQILEQQSPAAAEKSIEDLFLKTPFPESLQPGIKQGLETIGKGKVISVRSSAADEDSQSHSFAGQLSSYLYLSDVAEIERSIKKCWASGFSERSLSYRQQNKLRWDNISVAVVLQQMIDPDAAGVLFTCDPVAKSMKEFVVSSVYGVGEGLVSGALDADSFWLSADNGNVLRQEIVEKKEMMKGGPNGHTELKPVAEAKINQPSLNSTQLSKIYQLGKTLLEHHHRPQDVEWACVGNEVYLLQTRPVTSLDLDLIGYPNLWDNSNIVESYGGLTSPLSFSFALRNYRNVYVQFCEVLGVPNEIIKDMDSYLSYMLGYLRGRVYYNLFNWYKLVGVLPGFKQNLQFMETMMGVSQTLDAEIAQRIKPHPSWETWTGKLRQLKAGLNFLKYHFVIQSTVNDFLKTFHKDYDHYRGMDLRRLRGDQLIQIYFEVERNMLGRWKAPIINDFLCMVHFGLLRKLTQKWLTGLEANIQNDLLSGEGGLESAEPTRELLRLARIARENEGLKALLQEVEPQHGLEALSQSVHKDFYNEINTYLDRFGFRCMSEMKLEEIDLVTDSSFLFVALKNYLRAPQQASDKDETSLRVEAEKKVAEKLSGLSKIFYFWVLKHARKAVKNRENTRFARTRIYGIARTIFQSIGEDLASTGVIEHPRDVFFLSIEEVFGIYNGTLIDSNLPRLVSQRKGEMDGFAEDIDSRILTRGPVYWKNSFVTEVEPVESESGEWDLKGLPCCPGKIQGIVKVIINPTDNLELNGEILVTARTDPGWVPLYPSISGLLVERGSLLSHSAIVAREMGIPAIVSIPGLLKKIKTGQRIEFDGQKGTIKILE